jgi:photosystem II stability/assembly factor-like uncharacterized protein
VTRLRRRVGLGAACLLALSGDLLRAQASQRDAASTSLTLFAGSRDGLRRSRDWGNSWERVDSKGLEGLGAVYAIVASAPRVFVGGDGGLYVSSDFGDSWKPAYPGQPVLAITLSRYPLADPTVFLGTPNGLLRSSDGGKTFGSTTLVGAPVYRIEWPGPDLFVASGRGVSVSTNAAVTLRQGQGLPSARVASLALSTFYSVDPVGFAGTAGAGLFRSTDGGLTWTERGLAGRIVNDLYWFGPILSAATDAGFLQSDDGGATWSARSDGLQGRAATRILFPLAPASGAEIFLGTERGVFWSGDGGVHWRATGLKDETILVLATFPPPDPVLQRRRR